MSEHRSHATATKLDEWNDSLSGDYLWSSVNFGEAVTDVMTPLTSSVIRFTLDDWLFLPGWPTVGVIGARPYLNISIFATLYYALGRSRQDLLNYMESTLYMRLPDEMPIPAIPASRWTVLRGLYSALQVQARQRRGVQEAPAYLESNKAWFQDIRRAIQAQTTELGLHSLWQAEIQAHVKRGVWCVLGSATYSAEYTLRLRRDLAERLGPDDANILIANLRPGDAPLDSLGPVVGLHRLSRGEILRTAYLEDYGHRGPHEFELSLPRPAEDPAWLEQELERMRRSPIDLEGLIARQRQSFEAAWQRLQALPSGVAKRFNDRIAESSRRTRLRELCRSAYVRDRWAIRLFAVRAGELAGLGDQVFYLTLPELLALLSGDRSGTQAIGRRMEVYQQYRMLPPYPAVIRGRFDPFAWAADPDRSTDIFDATRRGSKGADRRIVAGSPGSSGVVEGTIRVIDDPAEGDSLQPGEIMVAVQTDIAWTLFFPRAAAVITDIGAPLSHAAIVARELGIPAVVGCGNATMRLRTGDRVRVDGGRGEVEILESRDSKEA